MFFGGMGYKVHQIRVTDLFKPLTRYLRPRLRLVQKPLLKRYQSYISYGDQIRSHAKDASILAALSIQNVIERRINDSVPSVEKFTKNVFLIHQFKRPEEIDLLRSVYGRIFFQISVYSMRSSRVDYLSRKFAEDAGEANTSAFRADAERLVEDDENEAKETYGQRVSKTFHDADLILNRDVRSPAIGAQINRFFELLFSSNTITPTKMEYGMFAAKSAALRTSDLSRQVGAAVFSTKGEIIALGSNEVPKAGGGTYWPDENFDDREFRRKIDSNEKRKTEILADVLKKLNLNLENLSAKERSELQDSSLMDALEYGRIIHAEMSAITDAARLRGALGDATMYTTTFPCHMCAKHIVASGLKQVIYLEPYPKSLAARLHSDSIDIDRQARGEYAAYPAVDFLHFYGVTPRRYRELFHRGKRKDDDGNLLDYVNGRKIPNIDIKSPFYAQLEDTVLGFLREAALTFRM